MSSDYLLMPRANEAIWPRKSHASKQHSTKRPIMPRLYTRPSSVLSGEPADDVGDGSYGVFASVAGESCSLLVASGVLAASVIIWEACAFAALAAALVAGVTWCLNAAAAAAGTASPTAAAPASRACGLAEVDISALPKSRYQRRRGLGGAGDGVECAVCLEDLRGGEMVRSLPECRHLFHVGCIDAWLQMHVTCPLCRSDLSARATTGHGRRSGRSRIAA